jgi:peptide/nickel transport system substrate-binding protein
VFQYAPDPQVLTARLLAGTVDLVPPGTTIKPEQMVELKKQWAQGAGVITTAPNDLRILAINARDPGSPWADPRFRQAMLLSLNRPEFAQVLQYGLTDVAYYFGFPNDPVYKMAQQQGVPKYDYDPQKAAQLFAAAGWKKGADGVMHNSAGQVVPTFTCCRLSSDQDSNDIRESLAIGEALKSQGMDAQHPVPDAPAAMGAADARKFRALSGYGATFGNFRVTADQNWATFVKDQIPTEENKWQGLNTPVWLDTNYEDLFNRTQKTLNAAPRTDLQFQLEKLLMEQLPALPTYYNPLGLVYKKGLEGVGSGIPLNRGIMWNIHTWDIK